MLIEKIINNNIVSAVDSKGREVVVMGRGLFSGIFMGESIRRMRLMRC